MSIKDSDRAAAAQAKPSGQLDRQLSIVRSLSQEDPAQALKLAEALLPSNRDPRVFRLAADACRRLGLHDDAVAAELAGIQAGLADPELARAASTGADGRWDETLRIAQDFLEARPDDLLAMTIAAEAETRLWKLEQAEERLRSILKRAPTFLRASMLLAECLSRQPRVRDAIAVLDEVLVRKPNNVAALTHASTLKAEVRDVEGSVEIYRKLVSLEPKRLEPLVNLGQYYRMLGRRDEAVGSFRSALALDPGNGSAWWSLTNYFPAEIGDADEKTMYAGLTRYRGTLHEGSLHLALGLLADRRAEYSEAFKHFEAGKRVRLKHQPYDPAPVTTAVDEVISIFTPELYQRRKPHGFEDSAPVFILGMPRSGSTLVERILGRHTSIEATGELQILKRVAERARHEVSDPDHYGAVIAGLSDENLAKTGERYVCASRDFRLSDKPHFIDKNNTNWLHLPLVLLALPGAKVIDVRRNALDCCWANFKMLFGEGFPAANDLRHIGRFYADYVRMVDTMKQVAPDRLLQIRYEAVVDNIEAQTRRMLEFVGVPYEPACLDFHLSTDAVATASSEQVRQPINRKGVGSAAPYRQWLGPLIDALGPLADV